MTTSPTRHTFRLSDLAGRKATEFELLPETEERMRIADDLGIIALKKLRFKGKISPKGRTDWQLEAEIGATVVQECVVTLAPVTTRIDEKILRNYVADFEEALMGEIEMDEDDTVEVLPHSLDLYAVMVEALDLALPPYPRAAETDTLEITAAPAGAEPILDEEVRRPFAGLAALRDELSDKNEQ